MKIRLSKKESHWKIREVKWRGKKGGCKKSLAEEEKEKKPPVRRAVLPSDPGQIKAENGSPLVLHLFLLLGVRKVVP